MIDKYNDEINLPYNLLLIDKQSANICKVFAYSWANMKLSKTQISKTIQCGWILGSILGLLIKIGLPLMKNVLTPLAKSMLVLFASKTAVSPEDVGIHQNTIWSRDPKISGFEYKALAKKLKISWRYLKLWCINRRYS